MVAGMPGLKIVALERSVRFRWPTILAGMLAGSLFCAACEDATGPDLDEARFIVVLDGWPETGLTHRLGAFGMDSGELIEWSPPVMFRIARVAVSPPDSLMFVTGTGPAGWTESQIAVVDWNTLETVDRRFFADENGYRRETFGGLAVSPTGPVTLAPDGRRLFIGDARNETGEWGIAVLGAHSLEAEGFIGPFADRDFLLSTIPDGEYRQGGAIVATIPDTTWPHAATKVVVVDPGSLAIVDTLQVSTDGDGIVEMVPGPHGRHLYVRTGAGRLSRYDLTLGATTTTATVTHARGRLAVVPDGSRLYYVQRWTHDWSSPAVISVYDSDLTELPPIDLSGMTEPPALNMAAVRADGTLIVAAGAIGPQLWGQQPGRILMVDPETGRVVKETSLDGEVAVGKVILLR